MNRLFTLLAAIIAVNVSAVALSVADIVPLDVTIEPINQPSPRTLMLSDRNVDRSQVSMAAADNTELAELIDVEGEWYYYSGYNGKSYPTEVKFRHYNEATDEIWLKNALFDSIRLSAGRYTGDLFIVLDGDVSGLNDYVFPEILDDNGQPTGVGFRTVDVGLTDPIIGNWALFPMSGEARISVIAYQKDENGQYDMDNATYYYDYLYNKQPKDCSITADYARGYYKGESSAKVKLNIGTDVTDLYYIIANSFADEKLTAQDPDWKPGQHYGRYKVIRAKVADYIAEFKAGETNEAYQVGRISLDAKECDIPLPDDDGLKQIFIVAYSGDEISDVVYDMIEVRRPSQWTHYSRIYWNGDIEWSTRCTDKFEVIKSGYYDVEVNADSTCYRIVKPFLTVDNPDANYIYLRIPDGRKDKCYIEGSYSPFERTYSFTDYNGEINQIKHPFIISDYTSFNIFNGFYASDLEPGDGYDSFIDFESGLTKRHVFFVHDYNTFMYCHGLLGNVYTNVSAYAYVDMQFDDYIVVTPDNMGVKFEGGPDVDHVNCTMQFDSAGMVATLDASAKPLRVDLEDGVGYIDLIAMLDRGEIPAIPAGIYYEACSADGKSLRSNSIDLTEHHFAKSAMADVFFPSQSGSYFSDSNLMVERDDLGNGYIRYNVLRYGRAINLAGVDSEMTVSLVVTPDKEIEEFEPVFINYYNIRDYGTCAVYLEIVDLAYHVKPDDDFTHDVIEGWAYLTVYGADSGELIGYIAYGDMVIWLPEELTDHNSGAELVTVDDGSDVPAVYYDIHGRRVDNMTKGTLLIEQRGHSVRKVVF